MRIREASGFSDDVYGIVLAAKAFSTDPGPLTDTRQAVAEQEALRNLMVGSLGSYKNPHSHRKIVVTQEDAVEMLMLASHLLKIVDDRSEPN